MTGAFLDGIGELHVEEAVCSINLAKGFPAVPCQQDQSICSVCEKWPNILGGQIP